MIVVGDECPPHLDRDWIARAEHDLGIAGHEADCWRCNMTPEDVFVREFLEAMTRPVDPNSASSVVPIVLSRD